MTPSLTTRRGSIRLPADIPVNTFGNRYPLDERVRPYLPRLAEAVMVSHHYAKHMEPEERPPLPLFISSGGSVSLRDEAKIIEKRSFACIELPQDDGVETIHPMDLLEFQEGMADVAFTLGFAISPSTGAFEARRRQELTIQNAIWALSNRRRKDLLLFASLQAWDAGSARACAEAYAGEGFDGVAIGGLATRATDRELVLSIVRAVRD